MALGLQQKHVIHIVVGPNATACRCVAGHNVVQPPVRDEPEVVEQISNFRYPVVQALDQQGPVLLRQLAETIRSERAIVKLPGFSGIVLDDDAGFNGFFAGQSGQLILADRALKTGKRLADNQWLFLPVVAQKFSGCQPAKHIHGVAPA